MLFQLKPIRIVSDNNKIFFKKNYMKREEPMITKVILRRNKVRGHISSTLRLRRAFNCNITA